MLPKLGSETKAQTKRSYSNPVTLLQLSVHLGAILGAILGTTLARDGALFGGSSWGLLALLGGLLEFLGRHTYIHTYIPSGSAGQDHLAPLHVEISVWNGAW